jgi:hypothetical protein
MNKLANIKEQIQEDIIACCESYHTQLTDSFITSLCQIVCDNLPNKFVLINTDDVDWNLLREQKYFLIDTNVNLKSEHIEGLIQFLDDIQDKASTILGDEAVFGYEF